MEQLLEATARAERHHFWFRGFRRFVGVMLSRAAGSRRDLTVLDCGCGTGTNLWHLASWGRAFGVELEPTGLRFARASGLTRVARGTVARLPVADGTIDLVTSFDVLTCLEAAAERAAVAEMLRVLRPGGHAVINVAAVEFLKGNHSLLAEEKRRYYRHTLRALLEAEGFEILRVTYTNFTTLPVLLPVRLAQQLSGLHMPEGSVTETTVPPAPVNLALTLALAAEAMLIKWVDMPVGSSLLCLARKPGR